MPAFDVYHQNVKNALLRDGWSILSEHFELKYRGDRLYPDIAAEKPITALRGTQKILVEIKSFLGRSFVNDLQAAIGQYVMYRGVLEAESSEFVLYLAVPDKVYQSRFESPLAQLTIQQNQVNLVIFDSDQEKIVSWINS
jgi:hypothetical protein